MQKTTISVSDTAPTQSSARIPNPQLAQTVADLPATAKVAFVSDDGVVLNRHFGQARHYLVVTLEDGQIVGREMRARTGHGSHRHGHDHDHDHAHGHDHDHAHGHDHDHAPMLAAITDCQVLVAGGMGFPVRDAVQAQGLILVLAVSSDIDQILADYLAGTLAHNPRLAHQPGNHHHD